MNRSLPILFALAVGCGDPVVNRPSLEGAADKQQSAGFVQAAPTSAPPATPEAMIPKAVEPTFNGGFEDRNRGNCYPVQGETLCDIPTQLPFGWTITQGVLWEGVYFRYGDGHAPLPPRPGLGIMPDATTLMFSDCNPLGQLRREQDGCVGNHSVESAQFGVTPGALHRLSAWVRWEPDYVYRLPFVLHTVVIRVSWLNSAGQLVAASLLPIDINPVPRREWQQFGMDVEIPSGATLARVTISAQRLATSITFIDDVRLEPR